MISKYLTPGRVGLVALLAAMSVMVASVALAEAFKPTRFWAAQLGEPHYGAIVPKAFGNWAELPNAGRVVVDPVQAENLARIYTETLARTYVHKPTGRMIMLSIAYGRDQSSDTQLHTPEQCYPSQGFRIESQSDASLRGSHGVINTVRMVTRLGQRPEPLTFFIRVGDRVVRGSKERNLERLRMAVNGYLVDGMLFRVSELSTNSESAFQLQAQFIDDLMGALPVGSQRALIGSMATM